LKATTYFMNFWSGDSFLKAFWSDDLFLKFFNQRLYWVSFFWSNDLFYELFWNDDFFWSFFEASKCALAFSNSTITTIPNFSIIQHQTNNIMSHSHPIIDFKRKSKNFVSTKNACVKILNISSLFFNLHILIMIQKRIDFMVEMPHERENFIIMTKRAFFAHIKLNNVTQNFPF